MRWLVGVVFLAACLSGCGGGSGEPVGDVSGTVKLDGAPLPEGEIWFAVEGRPPVNLDIHNGAYKGRVLAGKNRIQITAYTEAPAPATATAGVTSQKVNRLPARYSSESKLEKQVLPNTGNPYDFDLTSGE